MDSTNLSGVINLLSEAIHSLSNAGADFAIMASNTPHLVFSEVAARSPIPLISIVEETGKAASRLGFGRVGLFGTKLTMQASFYSDVISTKYGVSVVAPEEEYQDYIHSKIMTELVNGCIVDETKQGLSKIARMMADKQGIEAIILGCTELPLILSEEDVGIPLLNTTRIHAEAALDYAQSD